MKILLLKASKSPEDLYEKELKLAGHEPHFVNVLHFQFINSERLSSALHSASSYSGVAFTSQTAVQACEAALSSSWRNGKGSSEEANSSSWREQLVEQWSSCPVFVVGKATASEVAGRLGLLSATGSTSGNAEELSKAIVKHFKASGLAGTAPLLFPCSSIRRDTLPSSLSAAGLPIEEVTCYETVPHPLIAENTQRFSDQVSVGEEVGVVFFSPSGVSFALEKLLQIFGERQINVKMMAIGKTTAEALSAAGHAPFLVAVTPSPPGLVAALNSSSSTS